MPNLHCGISEGEFDALPAALRRKYFSSLERLRLVQDGISSRPVSRHDRALARNQTKLRSRSQAGPVSSQKQSATASSTFYERRPSTAAYQHSLPSQIAALFHTLPPAIQRKHFSSAERILLNKRKDSVILDAADEAFFKRGRQKSTNSQVPPLPARELLSDTLAASQATSDADMDDKMHDDFRWLDEDEELDLRLDDYHTALTDTTQATAPTPQRRPSFRRHLSLSSLHFRRNSSISSLPGGVSSTASPASQTVRPLSTLLGPRSHRPHQSVSSIDPRASHYQDPEARLKLRVYLASPQKFDEAIEFGFPSSQDRLQCSRPKTSPRLTHESGRTFFTDDTPSLSADEEDDDDDDDEKEIDPEDTPDPRTPEEATFQARRVPHRGTSDKAVTVTPRIIRGPVEPYAQASAADREMTLHMTLTRPDLRTTTDPVSRHVNDEPLEQAALPVEDVTPSIWDTLPEESSRIKKIWKKLIHK